MPLVEPDVMEFGNLLRDVLAQHVADPGTGIDTGGGMGSRDLWVKHRGVEFFITVARCEAQPQQGVLQ